MSLELINNYQKALDAVYEHVGFKEEWVVCPLDPQLECYWHVDDKGEGFVRYAETIDNFFSEDDEYYQDEIYTQRFYSKWVFEGKDFTMVFCNPGVDGMKWFRLFDNKKRIRTLDKNQYLRKLKLEVLNEKT